MILIARKVVETEICAQFLAPTSEEPYISESVYLCLSLSIYLSETELSKSNISAPDHLIQMKFGSFISLRLKIMILTSEQLATAVISCQQLSTTVDS